MHANLRALIVFAVLSGSTFCEAQTGAIKGRVTDDETGEAVLGAIITLLHAARQTSIQSLTTDFMLDSLGPRSDTLRIAAIGYHTIVRPILIKSDTATVVNARLIVIKPDYEHMDVDLPGWFPPPKDYGETHCQILYVAKEKFNSVPGGEKARE